MNGHGGHQLRVEPFLAVLTPWASRLSRRSPVAVWRSAVRSLIACLQEPFSRRPTAIELLGRYRVVEPTNATLDVSVDAIPSVTRPFVLRVHRVIDRHGATLNTALILILAFVVAIHCPDHGVSVVHLRGR
jgi:hypothetical protein